MRASPSPSPVAGFAFCAGAVQAFVIQVLLGLAHAVERRPDPEGGGGILGTATVCVQPSQQVRLSGQFEPADRQTVRRRVSRFVRLVTAVRTRIASYETIPDIRSCLGPLRRPDRQASWTRRSRRHGPHASGSTRRTARPAPAIPEDRSGPGPKSSSSVPNLHPRPAPVPNPMPAGPRIGQRRRNKSEPVTSRGSYHFQDG